MCDPDAHSEVILADWFEAALLGFGWQFTREVAVYDVEKCLAILHTRDGMSRDEAVEYFEFNVIGAWVGPHTPVFVHLAHRLVVQ